MLLAMMGCFQSHPVLRFAVGLAQPEMSEINTSTSYLSKRDRGT